VCSSDLTQVDNKIPGVASVAQRSGRPLKSIKDRLNGKGGRMRGNLMAKRVDFSARSVITADPNISIRDLGIPMKIAKNITKPVSVNSVNKAFLTKLVLNGPDEWPGAKILEKKNGESITLRYVDRKSIVLEDGDIVHRHMMDGDPILFNRQPTLHRMSMMCHIAKIMKRGDTFRMNVADTKPYNADFDGDEMNLHMPQDVESESELKNLAAVPYQLISPANNKPIIGIYQDSMLGCYRFTRENVNFTPREAMNLLMMFQKVNVQELLAKGDGERISSFDLLSQIMQPLTMGYKTKAFKDDEDSKTSNHILEIRNGKYIRGQIDKDVLGAGTKGLIQRSCNDFGNMAASNFIDDLQNIITEYMKSSSFSVGISDLISDDKTNQEIINVIEKKKQDVKNLIDQTQIGVFENNTGKTNEQEFETQVNNILNQASSEAGKIGLKSLDKNNRFVIMVNAGSKGSDLNISQMISCLGQQNVDGKRIPYGFDQRTLPHYTKFDDSPGARGFVESSYINGLSPQELFFHAMGGRVGLIDTAVKTSTTGYIQRRIIKGLEDLMVNYDMTIRTNKNKIVQFAYGEDGIDTIRVENQQMPIVSMSIQDIYAHFNMPEESGKFKGLSIMMLKNTLTRYKKQKQETNDKCKMYTDFMIGAREEIIKNVFKNKSDSIVNCPVALSYIVNNIQGQQNINANSLVDITPLEAFAMIEETYANLEKIHYAPPTQLFKVLYYYYLSPKDLLFVKRFNKTALSVLLNTIQLTYKRAIVTPGEMVGMLAAQSIGEVSTQMTLNSVTYETPIIVRNSAGKIQKVCIGDFVGKHIDDFKKLEYYSENDTTYAEPKDYFEIPSCDEDGNVVWKQIEAVTKHPVINTDGTNTMLKFTTEEMREVIVTKAKSLLKLVDGKIVPTNGDEFKVGDYLPVNTKQIDFTESRSLNLREILPPTEYVYSTEVAKAMGLMKEYHWWSKHQGKTFTLPYTRSDSFVAKVSDKLRHGCKSKTSFVSGCVYTKQTNMNAYTIPEEIPLDYNFGYLVGAYAAEGCMTKFQISIANNDEEYFDPIMTFVQQLNVSTKLYKQENKGQQGWTSQDLRIYNTILCRILDSLCGKLSHNKFVSDKIVFSNKECIQGFLDAYIGGDGTINAKDKSISMSSVSKEMLIDVQQMLNNIGIYSFIKKLAKQNSNNRGTLPENIHQGYILYVRNDQAKQLAAMLNVRIAYKKENCRIITNHASKFDYKINRNYLSVPNEINGVIVIEPRRDDSLLDVLFDKIKSIEEVPNTTGYAYDLTVADTRNFNIYNGLAIRDTFHFAGVAAKSNVTRGVPRIEEILSLSSEPKNPSLTVFLKKEEETDKDKAHAIMYMLEHTILQEIVESIEICFDPDDLNTMIAEDKSTMEQYRAFENLVDECANVSITEDTNEKSKWIVRMVMDQTMMLEKNITMDDVNFTLKNSYGDEISCVFSDYNSDKLVFRVRMNNVMKQNSSKSGQKKKVNPLDQSDQIYILKNFQDQLLQNIVLRGVKGINKVIMRKIKDNVVETAGTFKKQDIWVLDTVGSNMMSVLALDYIDASRTISNDIVEVFNVLGIEAARQTIYNELVDVIEFDGTYINSHNFSLLCDRMTFTSKMISIFRHGINNDNIGPIAKASFEETPEMFLKAARHAELDTMRGISANVMCGQEGFYGTSAFQVILDIDEMRKFEETTQYEAFNDQEDIEKMFEGVDNPDDTCSTTKLVIQNNVVSIGSSNLGSDNNYNPGF
jgi:DNA-directed RNA polymerase beta' subunit